MKLACRLAALLCVGLAAAAAQRQAPHWAYQPLVRPVPPEVGNESWCRGPLDRFVLARLEREGLAPAPAADRATWLRRVALDLVGLPPSPEEVAAFERDQAEDAFERQVDRLLALEAYGERQALPWLDLARYADSQGYEKDALRPHVWRWRDWVIDALNRDLPFDQFAIEQLAGDLLPDATLEQQVATAFHRHTMTNTEGGTDDEEFRVDAVVDRVNTTMAVFLGTTMACAQCHDHKYDPFTQREYFQLFAFFNQTEDHDQADERPTLRAPTPAQQQVLAQVEAELARLRALIDAESAAREAWLEQQRQRIAAFDAAAVAATPWHWLGPVRADSFDAAYGTGFAPERGVDLLAEQEGLRWQRRDDFVDGVVHSFRGDDSAFYLHRVLRAAAPCRATLLCGSDDAIRVFVGGAEVLARKVARPAAPAQERIEIDLPAGDTEVLLKIANGGGPAGFCFELRATAMPPAVEAALRRPAATLGEAARRELLDAFAAFAPAVAGLRRQQQTLERSLASLRLPEVPVLRELPAERRRTTRVHLRGSFLTQGEAVTPQVPACWPPLPEDAPRNRLGLARWIVAADNPLCARVQANRLWGELFGRGLVPTSEDFGSQGEPPSHPELLDWLAAEFRDDGWSQKRFLRRIVLSATYRQSPIVDAGRRARDPDNVLLSRGPSFRLSGEVLRDQVLAVSGLLQHQVGGPSVMPDQPEGIWTQIYSGERWQTSTGKDRWRRSLYTLWRRTSPHPAMTVFDAPSREYCVVRRVRTSTPLQALVTWNEPQFAAAAQALAQRVLAECGDGDDGVRLERMMRLCLLRAPDATERATLLAFVARERDRLIAACREAPAPGAGAAAVDPVLAAWTLCAGVLLNLDEFVTRG